MSPQYDLIVVGAGSGGIGAALAAARYGIDVLLIEQASLLGGTAVTGGVSVWEMGVGGTGLPFEIYRRLAALPHAAGIDSIGRHCLWPGEREERPYPGGESVIDPDRRYIDTLQRYGARSMQQDEAFVRERWHGVPFEPFIYAQVVEGMLLATGHCSILKGTRVSAVETRGDRVTGIKLHEGTLIEAKTCIDATGDGVIARMCGVETLFGQEAGSRFNEPDAPEKAQMQLNGGTLIYRVTPRSTAGIDDLPGVTGNACWWADDFPVASITHFPCGDLHINMLPTIAGIDIIDMGRERAYMECQRRVFAHWHYLQTYDPEFQRYRLHWMAPQLGVRESKRIPGEYVLTENDLLAGISAQSHGDIITLADHAMDTHGQSTGRAGCGEMHEPYGIPFRCLIPKGMRNLLIACRAASFSSLAASSARLSRTMMQLGQAAGTASALACQLGMEVAGISPDTLREQLRAQHVQLEHPMPPELKAYLVRDGF
ncbi:MAG: FAD-dependent oxidoreductase [Anaerolineae bacterium]|nr:FAD-dependent oxidoreductase [Anaerolineae bacterium]